MHWHEEFSLQRTFGIFSHGNWTGLNRKMGKEGDSVGDQGDKMSKSTERARHWEC